MTKSIEFKPASRIRYFTMDSFGNIYPVTDLVDRCAHDTDDPAIAEQCLIHCGDRVVAQDASEVPIYTVH